MATARGAEPSAMPRMESVTGKSSLRTALAGSLTRGDWIGLALGAALIAVLLAIDLVVDETIFVGVLIAPAFLTALFARVSLTLLVGLMALAIAAASPEWNMNFGESAYWIRLSIVGGGGLFAAASAWNRQRSRMHGERLRILNDVGAIADGSRPLDETLRRVTELVVPQVADLCMVDAVHGGSATRAAVRVSEHPRRAEIERRLADRPPELPRWLLREEREWRHIPRWRPRVREEELRRMARSPDDLEFLLSLRPRSLIVVPVASRDRNLGALTLISAWSRRRYTGDDVHFAQILASRIGLALDNAGLFSDLESVERRMDSVMSLLDEAVVIHARDGDLVYANPAAARTMGFDSPEELIAAQPAELGRRLALRDAGGRPLGSEALTGSPEIGESDARTAVVRATDRETGREHWYRTKARAVPGADGEQLYSVTAIEDVTDVKRAEFAQSLLARTGELLARSTDYRRTLEEVAELVVPEFADWCGVNVPREDGVIEQVALAHADPDKRRAARELRERYPVTMDDGAGIADVLRSGEPQLVPDAGELVQRVAKDDEHLRLIREAGVGSVIGVPVTAGGEIVGALGLVNEPGSRAFDAEDLELAVELGRRTGIAVEHARIAEARARVADTLQRELLPADVPQMPGWEVATMYRPAGEVNEVGGDFYEAFSIGDAWALVLGDVSGHGASAASITALARHTVHTAMTLAGDPAVGLRVLDARLRERDAVALCSVAVLVLPASGPDRCEVRVWLAGHPPPFLLRGGAAVEIGEPGPLVGIGENPSWSATTVSVRPGDQLVIYTDGVTEARGASGERFGSDRLRERLAASSEPGVAVGEVEAALSRFVTGDPKDDAALVAVRRLPAAPHGAAADDDAAAPELRTVSS